MGRLAPLALLFLIAGAGCDTFRPRRVEAPLAPPLHVSYAAPESTLDAMRVGIENRALGVDAYVRALADTATDGHSFYATMDPGALTRWESDTKRTPPDTWTLDRERNFIGYFVNTVVTQTCQMEWQPGRFQDDPGSGVYYRKYLVYTVTDDGDPKDTLAIGFARLTVLKVAAGRYAVTRWDDEVDTVDPGVGVDHPNQPDWQSFTSRRLETY